MMIANHEINFFNINNLKTISNITKLLNESNLEGCIIGGNAVSTQYVSEVYKRIGSENDESKIYNSLKDITRDTADVDMIVNGKLTDEFLEKLKEYYSTEISIRRIGDYAEVHDSGNNNPHLSIYFSGNEDNTHNELNQYYKQIASNSETKKLVIKKKEYNIRIAKKEDLILLKLQSLPDRIHQIKKKHDLIDLNRLFPFVEKKLDEIIKSNNVLEGQKMQKYILKIKKGIEIFKEWKKN